jgi:hypothetical protein
MVLAQIASRVALADEGDAASPIENLLYFFNCHQSADKKTSNSAINYNNIQEDESKNITTPMHVGDGVITTV